MGLGYSFVILAESELLSVPLSKVTNRNLKLSEPEECVRHRDGIASSAINFKLFMDGKSRKQSMKCCTPAST
jgi:hypothetical protein